MSPLTFLDSRGYIPAQIGIHNLTHYELRQMISYLAPSPIRTITVGLGITPNQPWSTNVSQGSRASV